VCADVIECLCFASAAVAAREVCFDMYDEDGSGFITMPELAKVLMTIMSKEDRVVLERGGTLGDWEARCQAGMAASV
jgi:hypothetical protein